MLSFKPQINLSSNTWDIPWQVCEVNRTGVSSLLGHTGRHQNLRNERTTWAKHSHLASHKDRFQSSEGMGEGRVSSLFVFACGTGGRTDYHGRLGRSENSALRLYR